MTTIAIFPDDPQASPIRFRAIAGEMQSVGSTAGEALDALTAKLGGAAGTTMILVQTMRPDVFFTEEQQRRLGELMAHWRIARDADVLLSPSEQTELDSLVEAELQAASERSAAMVRPLSP